MNRLYNAIVECRHEIDKRNFQSHRAIAYAHPNTVKEALADSDAWVEVAEPMKCGGVTVEKTTNLPENMVVLCHIDAARHGPEAIAFAELGE